MIDPRTLAASKILEDNNGGAVAVSKPVRAGFTTSTVIAAREMGTKLVCISPTTRIILETVNNPLTGGAMRVPGNHECPLIEDEIKKTPLLKEIPVSLNCEPSQEKKCPLYDSCPMTEIIRNPEFEVAALTYAKVKALMISKGNTAEKIRRALSSANYVLLDEAHILGFGPVATVQACELPEVPDNFASLMMVGELWKELLSQYEDVIVSLMESAETGHAGKHLCKSILILDRLSWKSLIVAWNELWSLVKTSEMDREEILRIRDAIDILSFSRAYAHYVTENDGETGSVWISGSHGKGERALWEFLHNVVPFAGHIYASGTMIEPEEGYFSELSGKSVKQEVFPDLKHASEQVTIIPDTWRLTAWNFNEKLPRIVDQIRQIAEQERQPIYCLCPNARKSKKLEGELKEAGIKGVIVDYYRSDFSMGVSRAERICIGIGMAELPANAMDPRAWGKDEQERWVYSRQLRQQSVHAATWQAINRVRDPEGLQESRVYMIGTRLKEIRELVKWGPNRQATPELKDKLINGNPVKTVSFIITVDQEVEQCKILGEISGKNHSERKTLFDMVERIELYDANLINSENHSISSITIYRDNGVILGIYNFPSNEREIDLTASSLYKVFVNREECFAQQFQDSAGKWGYQKILKLISREVIIDHIKGNKTIGVYEIGLDDDVIWGCFDVDTHDGGSGDEARKKVHSIIDVLRIYGIQFLLESSGTPGSYHVWVSFKRTKTYNAYHFMRQVTREANVEGVEIWPKQQHLDKNGKYGNLVKMPICLHRKTGNRSVFVDADTFEPLEGRILVPGRVVLLELPSPMKGMPKATKRKSVENSKLDYCMVCALKDKVPLEGAEGHMLRVAIAIKAQHCGMREQAAVELFKDQNDFDPKYTRSKIREIWNRDYSPMSCETLRDKCGELVTRSCPFCPLGVRQSSGMVVNEISAS